jgi:hypothetical protein
MNKIEKEIKIESQYSICINSVTFSDKSELLEIDIRIATISPSNLPSSSIRPFLKP